MRRGWRSRWFQCGAVAACVNVDLGRLLVKAVRRGGWARGTHRAYTMPSIE